MDIGIIANAAMTAGYDIAMKRRSKNGASVVYVSISDSASGKKYTGCGMTIESAANDVYQIMMKAHGISHG